MRRRILVIFEKDRPTQEAIQYSSELARRMDGDLVLLKLGGVPLASGEDVQEIARTLCKRGVQTGFEAREGDPRSELLKFLARSPAVLAVVWGGRDDVSPQSRRASAHWLSAMQGELSCPLITMQRKA